MIPIALLPERFGGAIMVAAYVITLIVIAHRLGASHVAIAAIISLPHVLHGLAYGNIDWMVMIGFVLPPQVGLFLVIIKPQLGVGLAIFWLYEAWKIGKMKQTIRTFGPETIAIIISFLIYRAWPLNRREFNANASMWPYSIPFGVTLLFISIHKHMRGLSVTASPLLSPYVGAQSWPIAILGLLPSQKYAMLGVAILWFLHIYNIYY